MITQDFVKELFDYKDGKLYWKLACHGRKLGVPAGTINKLKERSRRLIYVNKKLCYHSRIIFLYHHGYLPEFVDHIDRDTLNDRIENLRAATRSQNNKNSTHRKDAISKYKGVTKNRNTWAATSCSNRIYKHLGYFKTQEDAALAYNREAVRTHGEFANLNIIIP